MRECDGYLSVRAKCPACGHENIVTLNHAFWQHKLVHCFRDAEAVMGTGCDQFFSVEVELEPRVKVFKLQEV